MDASDDLLIAMQNESYDHRDDQNHNLYSFDTTSAAVMAAEMEARQRVSRQHMADAGYTPAAYNVPAHAMHGEQQVSISTNASASCQCFMPSRTSSAVSKVLDGISMLHDPVGNAS